MTHASTGFAQVPQRTVALGPCSLDYRDVGTGEPIVFVHGLLVNGGLWREVVPHLAPSFRCIVPDLPLGAHRSPVAADADLTPPGLANILAELLDALALEDVTLVANDTGGALAQILATTKPQRLARLVLTPCDMFDNFLPPAFRPLQWIGGTPAGLLCVLQLMRLGAVRNSPLGFGWLAKRPIPRPVTDDYLRAVFASAAVRRDVAKILRGISPRYTREAAARLADFDRPTLLAWATEDRVFPVEHAHRMSRILPDARVELIDDSYAFVPEDQPEQLATLIGRFIAETSRDGIGRHAAP